MILCIAALVAAVSSGPQQTSSNSPVFEIVRGLAGSKWEGNVGGVKVEFRFHMENDGNKFVGEGVIGVGSKSPMTVYSVYGWDPEAKQVYYLDQHGYQTVYFGHVVRDGNSLVSDFKGIVGDTGHYISTAIYDKDSYTATMKAEDHGAWVDLGEHITLHRVK